MASLMMLAVLLLAGDLYLTMDKREAAFEKKVTTHIDAAATSLNTTANSKFEELRTDLKNELDPVSKGAVKTLTAATGTLTAATGTITGAGTTMATLNTKVNAVDVAGLNASVKNIGLASKAAGTALTGTATALASVAKPLSESVQQVDAALPDFLDCFADGAGNPNCLYNRYVGIAGDSEQTMRAVREAAPRVAAAVEGMTEDGHKITADAVKVADKYTAPPTWWERIEAYSDSIIWVVLKALGL